jgi:hypothetical protein
MGIEENITEATLINPKNIRGRKAQRLHSMGADKTKESLLL